MEEKQEIIAQVPVNENPKKKKKAKAIVTIILSVIAIAISAVMAGLYLEQLIVPA